METISLPAHFDGSAILLDQPFDLKPNARLLVTILSDADQEREDWLRLSLQGAASAYGDEEPEYTLADVVEPANR